MNWFSEPLVNDQRYMGRPTAETGGGTPQNQGLSEIKVLPEQKGVGPRVQKPEQPKQQPTTPDRTLYERVHGTRRQSGVLENPIEAVPPNFPKNPSEQRGLGELSQPNPAEHQAAERLGKPPPQNVEDVVETLSPQVEAAIRAYAMGDPEEEAQLREQAKNDPALRDSLVNPGFGLVYRVPSMPPFLKNPDDA